jgi:hypothetical protein
MLQFGGARQRDARPTAAALARPRSPRSRPPVTLAPALPTAYAALVPTPPHPVAARLLGKLAALRASGVTTFGSNAHRFELAPPLAEAEIAAHEARLGVRLPDAYRFFLGHVGGAGAGPYYGLVPPERWDEALYGDAPMPDYAARPCVFVPGLPRDDATWARLVDGLDEPLQGTIVLCDQGCAFYASLVVTGPARGRVAYVNLDGGAPYFPEDGDFLAWYERWLDELAWGFEHHWFGSGMPGDEATLTAAAADPTSARRGDAIASMFQLRVLSPAARAAVVARLDDPEPAVRVAALGLAAARELGTEAGPIVARRAEDADPSVRLAALRVLAKGPDAALFARRALADADERVVVFAIGELARHGGLEEDDLVRALSSTSRAVRAAALSATRSRTSPRAFDAVAGAIDASGLLAQTDELLALLALVRQGLADGPRRDRALAAVLAALDADRGPDPPTACIYGLGAFLDGAPGDVAAARAFERLVALARSPDAFRRYEAVAVLGDHAGAEAVPVLEAITDDPAMPRAPSRSTAWSVGENARRALARIAARRG